MYEDDVKIYVPSASEKKNESGSEEENVRIYPDGCRELRKG